MCVLSIKVPIRKKSLETYLMFLVYIYSNRMETQTWFHIDLCDIPHIFYRTIIHTHCLWTLTGYYIYMIFKGMV